MMTGDTHRFHSISRDNNMNAVRYYLSLCIIVSHFATLAAIDMPTLPRIFGGAGSFFALSGFLMFPSFEKRPDPRRFFIRRARRIFPAYFFVVIVAAVSLVAVSSLPAIDYFTSSGFWKYLAANLTFLNFLAPDLPGVFTSATNPYQAVNGALWTMKGEVMCYLSVPLVYAFIRRGFSPLKVVVAISTLSALLMVGVIMWGDLTGHDIEVARKQFFVFMLFYMGAAINLCLPLIVRFRWWLLSINLILLGCNHFNLFTLDTLGANIAHQLVFGLVTGTMVIVCSITGHWGRFLAKHEAVSYDMYLFHYPIVQLIIYFGMPLSVGPATALLTVIVSTIVCAILSFHFVGRRFLTPRPVPSATPA